MYEHESEPTRERRRTNDLIVELRQRSGRWDKIIAYGADGQTLGDVMLFIPKLARFHKLPTRWFRVRRSKNTNRTTSS